MCILAHRSGAIRGLRGQTDWLWDICGDLRLSVSPEEEEAGIAFLFSLLIASLSIHQHLCIHSYIHATIITFSMS